MNCPNCGYRHATPPVCNACKKEFKVGIPDIKVKPVA